MELDRSTETTSASVTEVLRRVGIDYHPNGSIEVSLYYADRVTLPGQAPVDSPGWKPFNATYPDQAAMIALTVAVSGAPEAQVQAVLGGFVDILNGMRAALERPVDPKGLGGPGFPELPRL